MTRLHAGITHLRIVVINPSAHRGRLMVGNTGFACAIGRSGLSHRKREGDGASPVGRLKILGGYYRADRTGARPLSRLTLRPIRSTDGWCDQPDHPAYNRRVKLPFGPSHEEMFRADGLYDVVLVLDWNISPRQRNRGSAIFFHLARPDYSPTAGCVAVSKTDMRRLLARLSPRSVIDFGREVRPAGPAAASALSPSGRRRHR